MLEKPKMQQMKVRPRQWVQMLINVEEELDGCLTNSLWTQAYAGLKIDQLDDINLEIKSRLQLDAQSSNQKDSKFDLDEN